jgi:hypothetical protein
VTSPSLRELLAQVEGPVRLVVGKSLSIDMASGESKMVHTVHMYAEPDQPRRKAQQVGPVLVGDSFTELLTAVASVLDQEEST